MAEQVGEGYIEVEPRIDSNRLNRMASRFGKRAGDRFTNAFGIGWRQFRLDVSHVEKDIHKHGHRIGRNFGRNFVRGADAFLSLLPGRMEALFSGRGGPIGLALGAAILTGLAVTMPAIGAMISGAIFVGFGTGVVAAGIALVAKDARVVAAANRLKDMFTNKIWDSRGAELYARATTKALDRVTQSLERWAPLINRSLIASSKFVQHITSGGIAFVDGFINPMTRFIESGFMDRLMKQTYIGMSIIGRAVGKFFDDWLRDPVAQSGAVMGLRHMFEWTAKLIVSTGDFLRLLSRVWYSWNVDPDGGGGAISKMERMHQIWAAIKRDLSSIGSSIGVVLGAIKTNLGALFKTLDESGALDSFKELWRTIVDKVIPALAQLVERNLPKVRSAMEHLGVAMKPIVDALISIGNWIADEDNQDNLDRLVTVILGGAAAFKAYNLAVRTAAVANTLFALSMGGIVGTQGTKGQKAKGGAKGGLLGGIVGALFGGSGAEGNVMIGGGVAGGLVGGGIGALIGTFMAKIEFHIMEGLRNMINRIFPGSKEMTNKFWTAIFKGEFDKAWNLFLTNWNLQWPRFTKLVGDALGAFKTYIKEQWGLIWGGITTYTKLQFDNLTQNLPQWLGSIGTLIGEALGLGNIGTKWREGWNKLIQYAKDIWSGFKKWLKDNWFVDVFLVMQQIIAAIWLISWQALMITLRVQWEIGKTIVRGALGWIKDHIGGILGAIWNAWKFSWAVIVQWLFIQWNIMKAIVGAAFKWITDFMKDQLKRAADNWRAVWDWVGGFLGGKLKGIRENVFSVLTDIGKFIGGKLGEIAKKWGEKWGMMGETLKSVMSWAKGLARDGIDGIIKIINKGIGGINWVLGKLGIKARIDEIPLIGNAPIQSFGSRPPGAAQGGRFIGSGRVSGPGGPTDDKVNARLSDGEYVVRAKAAKDIGYSQLDFINNNGFIPFMAAGGLFRQMTAWIKSRVPGTRVSSDYRPGDPGYHGKGQAIDMIFSDGSERRGGGLAAKAFNTIKGTFFSGIAELIWDFARGQAVWNGKNHFFTGGGAGPGTHNDHIHWAMAALSGKGGGGLLSGALEFLLAPWSEILSKMVQPAIGKLTQGLPDNGIGWILRGGASFLGKQIIPWIKKLFEAEQAKYTFEGTDAGDNQGSVASRWSGVASNALRMLGLPLTWLTPLLRLIQRESGGNPNAINRTDSNARRGDPSRGLMQTIGATFNAYRHPSLSKNIYDPLANIVAGLRYIQARYGSIFNVQQAVGATPRGYAFGGKFDEGGVWPNNTWALNTSGGSEYVFNGAQMSNSGCNHTTKVYIDGIETAHRSVVQENNRDLVNAIRRGRRGDR